MLVYLRTDLFTSPAQTLVNTVNTIGVMGKGVAKTFKARFPEMFREYKEYCDRGELRVSSLMLWRGPEKWVLNFPTKTTWRLPSKIEYVETGLRRFVEAYEELGITSVSFPPLGCGNGNLDWNEVKPRMEKYLKRVEIPVYIHDRQVASDFVPEHLESERLSRHRTLHEFISDVKEVTRHHSTFRTLTGSSTFRVSATEEGNLQIVKESRTETIPAEELESAWSAMQTGILTGDLYSGEASRRYKSYLFAILACLPYVVHAEVQHVRGGSTNSPGHALFFRPSSVGPTIARGATKQLALWQ
jgi:O-acetyl-ADP-ribose deacetylase (regulator of RNase III)